MSQLIKIVLIGLRLISLQTYFLFSNKKTLNFTIYMKLNKINNNNKNMYRKKKNNKNTNLIQKH